VIHGLGLQPCVEAGQLARHRYRFVPVYQYALAIHCNENPIYVFLLWELRGLSPNFHIHVSVSDLYIARIGPNIFLQQNRQIDCGGISKSLIDT
jgi:hypothetical protein